MAQKELSKELQASIEKQQKYWRERAERNFLAGEKDALSIAKQLQANYKQCIREINEKIDAFYGKYAKETGLSLLDAKKTLDKNALKDFKAYIKEMLSMGRKEDFSDAEMAEFKRLYHKAYITRLEELEANIRGRLDKLVVANRDSIKDFLDTTYEDEYYKSIYNVQNFKGYSTSFSGLNDKAINKAVSTKWLGANYNITIWKNQENLMQILDQEIPRGIAMGYNPRKLADQVVDKKIESNYNNVVRLIRTEYNKAFNDATLDGYKAAGITRYKILATLDNRTSEICQEMDSKIYKISEAETGVTYPPFHPNCRTTTIAYFEPDEFDEDHSLLNISYKEWKAGLKKDRNGNLIYKKGVL